ncbi:MAG: RICIN domain-containing protein [Microbacteriaceae bacterium]
MSTVRRVSGAWGRLPRWFAILALVTLFVGVGTTASFAVWTAATSKAATVTGGTIGVGQSGAAALAFTYTSPFAAPKTVTTQQVVFSNTGSTPLDLVLTSTGGNATLNARIELLVWVKGTPACTDTATATTGSTIGTLASPPVLPTAAATPAAGASVTLCVRTTLTGNPANSGELSTAPVLTLRGTVGNNWSTTATATFTQNVTVAWYEIVHTSGLCLDGNQASIAAGTDLILYPCKALDKTHNQAFRFGTPDGEGPGAFYRIFIGNGSASGPVIASASATSGADVELANLTTGTGTASNLQQWRLEPHGPTGSYRLVNRQTGFCAHMAGNTQLSVLRTRACVATTATTDADYKAQHFSLTEIP